MREILFRGQRTDTKEWVYGSVWKPCYYNDGQMQIHDGVCGISVDENTVGQFTGLTDKNGKKIFEGDILQCNNGVRHYTAKVVEDIANPCFALEYKSEYGFNDVEYDFVKCGNMHLEIIGNIYDNPELLGDANE